MSTVARDPVGKFCFLIWSVKLSTSPQFFNLINYKSQTMIRLGFWYWFVILSVIRYEHEKFYSRLCFFYFCTNEQERSPNSGQILYDDIDLRVPFFKTKIANMWRNFLFVRPSFGIVRMKAFDYQSTDTLSSSA